MISFIHGGPGRLIEGKSNDVGKMYIGNVFPSVSRSLNYESRAALGYSINERNKMSHKVYKRETIKYFNSIHGRFCVSSGRSTG